MIRHGIIRQWLESHSSWLGAYFFLFGAGFGILSLRNWGLLTPEMISFGHSWIGIFYLLMILIGVTSVNPLVVAAYKFGPLRMLGILSYFIYLSHGIVDYELHALICHRPPELYSSRDFLTTGLALLITVGLAAISWLLIEKPIIHFGHRWKYEPGQVKELDAMPR